MLALSPVLLSHFHHQAPPQAATLSKPTLFLGQEVLAIAARFISHLFPCPDYPPSTNHTHDRLPFFIAYAHALRRTKLHPGVTPSPSSAKGSLSFRSRLVSEHCPFFSKVMFDDTYSNKSWCIVVQGMYMLGKINQMEKEELTVDHPILPLFRSKETKSSYSNYPTVLVSRRALCAVASQSNTPFNEKSSASSAAGVHREDSGRGPFTTFRCHRYCTHGQPILSKRECFLLQFLLLTLLIIVPPLSLSNFAWKGTSHDHATSTYQSPTPSFISNHCAYNDATTATVPRIKVETWE